MAVNYTVSLDGDLKALKQLDRAITHAAKQALIAVAFESQAAIIVAIQSTFTIRGTWYLPSQRPGIHVRYEKNRDDLSVRIETLSDWLEEHETGEDRSPDVSGHSHLTVAHGARGPVGSAVDGYGSPSKVPAASKARRVLANASLLSTGTPVRTTGRPSKGQGKGFRSKPTPFFVSRSGKAIFERLPDNKLLLFYTLTTKSHIRKQSTVVVPTTETVALRFGPLYDAKLAETIQFRKG